jgi:hypothetical protein
MLWPLLDLIINNSCNWKSENNSVWCKISTPAFCITGRVYSILIWHHIQWGKVVVQCSLPFPQAQGCGITCFLFMQSQPRSFCEIAGLLLPRMYLCQLTTGTLLPESRNTAYSMQKRIWCLPQTVIQHWFLGWQSEPTKLTISACGQSGVCILASVASVCGWCHRARF